jgi:hypothetical protein
MRKLAAMFLIQAAITISLKAAYGPWAGYLWAGSFWIINPGSIAALSIALVSYLKGFSLRHLWPWKSYSQSVIIISLSLISCRDPMERNDPGYIHTWEFGDHCHIHCRRSIIQKGDYQHFTASSGLCRFQTL